MLSLCRKKKTLTKIGSHQIFFDYERKKKVFWDSIVVLVMVELCAFFVCSFDNGHE